MFRVSPQGRTDAVCTLRLDRDGNVRPQQEQFTMCSGNPLCEGFPARIPEDWLRNWRYKLPHEDLAVCGKKGKEKTKDFLINRFADLQGQVRSHLVCSCILSTLVKFVNPPQVCMCSCIRKTSASTCSMPTCVSAVFIICVCCCLQVSQGHIHPPGAVHPSAYFGVACPILQSLLMYFAMTTGANPVQLGLGICSATAAMLGAFPRYMCSVVHSDWSRNVCLVEYISYVLALHLSQ